MICSKSPSAIAILLLLNNNAQPDIKQNWRLFATNILIIVLEQINRDDTKNQFIAASGMVYIGLLWDVTFFAPNGS